MQKNFVKLIAEAKDLGASDAKIINVAKIKTGAWTRWKCQFGCPNYGHKHCCPPNVPTYQETQAFLKEYKHGLLVQFTYKLTKDDFKNYAKRDVAIANETLEVLLKLEKEAFLMNYYKAFALKGGTCHLCAKCGEFCNHPTMARPSMEAVGIDVFAFARDNGYKIDVMDGDASQLKIYCLVLLD
jgi:predicted metal-binding protein